MRGQERSQSEEPEDQYRRFRIATGWPGAGVLIALAAAATVVVLYGPDTSLSLVDGPVPPITFALALMGLIVGLAGRTLRWWVTWGLGIAVTAALLVWLLWWWLGAAEIVTQPYPRSFIIVVWIAFFAVGVALTGWWSGPAVLRVARFAAAPIVCCAAFLFINGQYGYWPTMGALLGRPVAGQVSGKALSGILSIRHPTSINDSELIEHVGVFGPVSIPSPRHFDAGGAWAWVPPMFDRVDHADLPVLVMLPGIPGSPYDWERAGLVTSVADAWARAHGGIAPVMVLVSENGAYDRDTECVNGPNGDAEDYLTRSVPEFLKHRFGISVDPERWAVVGFSEGGTCAIGLAAEHPSIFGRFVDIAGDAGPNIGPNNASTLVDLYGRKTSEILHHEPLWLLVHHRYPSTEGWFASSSGDPIHERVARELDKAAHLAGMKVFNDGGGPGGHSWTYATSVFRSIYPALVASMPAFPIRLEPLDRVAKRVSI